MIGRMNREAFAQDALLLIGHGSSRYHDAGRALHAHANGLRAAGYFAEAAVGLLRGSPSIDEALTGLTAQVVHVVPFFIEDGYFTRVAVPAAFGKAETRRAGHSLYYYPPVGRYYGLPKLIEARALRHCGELRHWALLLVGHGSRRSPGRASAVHRHQCALAKGGRFACVEAAFLEEAPLVPEAFARLAGMPVAVVGLFAGEGGHVRDDLPRHIVLAQAHRGSAGPPLIDLGPIGDDSGMQMAILSQMSMGRPHSRLRLPSRDADELSGVMQP